jgi:hypothetical protein
METDLRSEQAGSVEGEVLTAKMDFPQFYFVYTQKIKAECLKHELKHIRVNTQVHPVPTLKMQGDLHPLHHTSSTCCVYAHRQIHLCLFYCFKWHPVQIRCPFLCQSPKLVRFIRLTPRVQTKVFCTNTERKIKKISYNRCLKIGR